MSKTHLLVQRLIQNTLLLETSNDLPIIDELLVSVNEWMEAVNAGDEQLLNEMKDQQKIILEAIVFHQVLKMVYDPERLKPKY